MKVEFIAPTGPDTLVFAEINGRRAICRVHPAASPRPGDLVDLVFDTSRAVLFDPVTSMRI